jgi:hypothetical protein
VHGGNLSGSNGKMHVILSDREESHQKKRRRPRALGSFVDTAYRWGI